MRASKASPVSPRWRRLSKTIFARITDDVVGAAWSLQTASANSRGDSRGLQAKLDYNFEKSDRARLRSTTDRRREKMASMRSSIRKIAVLAGVATFAVTGGTHTQRQVNIICSVPITWCEALIAQFQKDTGIKVGMTEKGSGEAMAQVAAEKANPKYDL
jgi:hypothetical protein